MDGWKMTSTWHYGCSHRGVHNSWKGIVTTKLQLSCNELHRTYSELQVSDATQKFSYKANCKTPFFFMVHFNQFLPKYIL
jgi:hypothetical protein